jgi:hypothetical protein
MVVAPRASSEDVAPASGGPGWWRIATYVLGLTTVALLLLLLWVTHSSPPPSPRLYNAWVNQVRLVAQPGASLREMRQRSAEALGMTEAETATFGYSGSTAARVAADMNSISGSLDSMIAVTAGRQASYPSYTSRNMHGLRRVARQTARSLPAPVRSASQLEGALPLLDGIARHLRAAADAYSANASTQP